MCFFSNINRDVCIVLLYGKIEEKGVINIYVLLNFII